MEFRLCGTGFDEFLLACDEDEEKRLDHDGGQGLSLPALKMTSIGLPSKIQVLVQSTTTHLPIFQRA